MYNLSSVEGYRRFILAHLNGISLDSTANGEEEAVNEKGPGHPRPV